MKWQPERDHRVMPWANGRGSTKEIAAHPSGDAWVWRLSLADVDADGPFSLLPDTDRSLVVATGKGMRLFVEGSDPAVVRSFESVSFAGDLPTRAELLDGPVRDLNLMVRRTGDSRTPYLEVRHFAKGEAVGLEDAVAIVVLRGALTLTVTSAGFPYTPLRCRVDRFDAVLPVDGIDGRLVVAADALVAFAFLRSEDGRPADAGRPAD
jgi:environmental stress-induced protein Ves